MRVLSTAAASLLIAVFVVPALAAGPLDGRWAYDAEICANEPGSGDLVPTVIHDGKIDYYESHCEILEINHIGAQGSAWRVRSTCSGEGEVWTGESIFAIDHGNNERRRQLTEIDLADGIVMVSQACDGP